MTECTKCDRIVTIYHAVCANSSRTLIVCSRIISNRCSWISSFSCGYGNTTQRHRSPRTGSRFISNSDCMIYRFSIDICCFTANYTGSAQAIAQFPQLAIGRSITVFFTIGHIDDTAFQTFIAYRYYVSIIGMAECTKCDRIITIYHAVRAYSSRALIVCSRIISNCCSRIRSFSCSYGNTTQRHRSPRTGSRFISNRDCMICRFSIDICYFTANYTGSAQAIAQFFQLPIGCGIAVCFAVSYIDDAAGEILIAASHGVAYRYNAVSITPVEIIFPDYTSCAESDRIVRTGSDTGTRTENGRSRRLGETSRADDDAVLRAFFHLVISAAPKAAFFRILIQAANGDAVHSAFLDNSMIADGYRVLRISLCFCTYGNAFLPGYIAGSTDGNPPFCSAAVRAYRAIVAEGNRFF